MIPNCFHYLAPTGALEVVAALSDDPDGSVLLAGGSWLVPSLSQGECTPRQIIDLRRAGLRFVDMTDGQVRVGSCSTYSDLLASPIIAAHAPVLALMAAGITGGHHIVGRCTVGGSAAAARPGSDIPATLLLLGAEATVSGPAGTRALPVAQLWTGAFVTTLSAAEVIIDFRFPAAAGCSAGYAKIKHSAGSWPIVTAAAHVWRDPEGRCTRVSVCVGGAAAAPFPVPLTGLLDGRPLDTAAVADAVEAAAVATPVCWEDELAPASYRRAVVPAAVRRALLRAASAAPSSGETA